MEWWLIIILAFSVLIGLFCLGVPIAFSFLCLDIIGLYFLFGQKGMELLSSSIFDSVGSFAMSPVPLFILLGEVYYESKVVYYAFNAIDKWVGGIRARLHIVTLLFATIFGAISGSGMAMAAMLGSTVLPEMVERGYEKKLGLGVILGGGCLDPLIPPSVVAVLIAGLANVSIARILFSGIGPGIVLLVLLIIYVLVYVKIKPEAAPVYLSSTNLRMKLMALVQLLPFILIIFLILGLVMLGIATPTESAAVGVTASIVLAACYRKLNFQMMKNCVVGAINTSGLVLLIVAGSKAFSQVLAISGSTQGMLNTIVELNLSPFLLFLVMQSIGLFLGCFIDQVAIMLITIPFYIPLVNTAGFDPIWFWCIYLINMTVGGITPPFGYMLFTLSATAKDTTLGEIFKAAVPILFLTLLCMAITYLFPQIALWIPNAMVEFK